MVIPNLALQKEMAITFEQLPTLDEWHASEVVKKLLFNEDADVEFPKSTHPAQVQAVLGAGANWNGTG